MKPRVCSLFWPLALPATIAACEMVELRGRPYDEAHECWLEFETVGEQRANEDCGTAITLAEAPDGTCYSFNDTCIPRSFTPLVEDDGQSCVHPSPLCSECDEAGCPDAGE